MQALVILTFCVATLMDFATESKVLPTALKFTPEILSILIAGIVCFRGMRGRLAVVPVKYWFAFGYLAFVIVCGILSNSVSTGATLSGMRHYLRAIPLFFLPAVVDFSDKQLQQQLKVIVGLALLQVPIAIYQRYVIMDAGRFSGDDVRGTLLDSGVLSIFLIGVVVALTGFLMRGRLGKWTFLLLFFVLLLPTTINETKATVVLLPVGLMAAILAGAARGQRIKVFLGGTALLVAFTAILIPVYSAMNANATEAWRTKGLVEFFTNQEQLESYIGSGNKREPGLGSKRLVGRGTAISFPLKYLAHDPMHFAFGLGIGNASHSNLGESFSGTYYDLFKNFVVSASAAFLLEIGVTGTLFVFLLYYLVFQDALTLSRTDTELTGALATGWIGVVCVMVLATFYNVVYVYVSLSFPYWYFAGVVAARRGRLTVLQRSPARAPAAAAAARALLPDRAVTMRKNSR